MYPPLKHLRKCFANVLFHMYQPRSNADETQSRNLYKNRVQSTCARNYIRCASCFFFVQVCCTLSSSACRQVTKTEREVWSVGCLLFEKSD